MRINTHAEITYVRANKIHNDTLQSMQKFNFNNRMDTKNI